MPKKEKEAVHTTPEAMTVKNHVGAVLEGVAETRSR